MTQDYAKIFEKVITLFKAIQKNKKQFKQIYDNTVDIAVDGYDFGTEKAEEITKFATDKSDDVRKIAELCMDIVTKLVSPLEARSIAKPEKECTTTNDLANRIISQLPPMEFENTLSDVPRY